MKKFRDFLTNYWQFFLTVFVGIFALVFAIFARDFSNNFSRFSIFGLAIFVGIFLIFDMIKTLKNGKYGVDILAITAIVATLAVGEFWASLIIILMLTGGETLEDFAANRAKKELSELLKRAPKFAHILNEKGEILDVEISKVKPENIILVKAREVVPVDGILLEKSAEFDESSLTGESLPTQKKFGEKIMSGALNGEIAVKIRATATAENSQYEQIIALVRAAENQPAPFVRLADKYAIPFTLISYLIAGAAWFFSGEAVRFAEVLVVASPCPLILAAPIALISGMSRAAKHGIIARNGAVLEKINRANIFAFDKTGTLTRGDVSVAKILRASDFNNFDFDNYNNNVDFENSQKNLAEKIDKKIDKNSRENSDKNFDKKSDFSAEEILRLATGAESGSSHILANSLLKFAKDKKIEIPPAKNVREITGDGVFATVSGKKIIVGKADFLARNKVKNLPNFAQNKTAISLAQRSGTDSEVEKSQIANRDSSAAKSDKSDFSAQNDKVANFGTAVFVSVNSEFAGAIYFADEVRKDARKTLANLKKFGVEKIAMLTGDKKIVAEKIAASVGADEIFAELLPADKVKIMQNLRAKKNAVAFVGDGVNDAPVLAAADVGVAMGARGSTAASESADAVIMLDDLSRVALFRQISRRTIKIALQSVFVGIFLCLILEIIAALGFIPALIGAGLQEFIDVVVIFNALRAHSGGE